MSKYFGARVSGRSGSEVYYCTRRADADRIRRVIRAWDGWTGAATLAALARLAAVSRGMATSRIIAEFRERVRLIESSD